MKHRFTFKVVPKSGIGKIFFRCKRCNVRVSVPLIENGGNRSPYKECDERGIPRDCNISIAKQIMES